MSDIEIIKKYGSIENYIYELEQENQQLKERYLLLENKCIKQKEVIDEAWNFIKKYPGISQSGVMTIKQILDKVKEN